MVCVMSIIRRLAKRITSRFSSISTTALSGLLRNSRIYRRKITLRPVLRSHGRRIMAAADFSLAVKRSFAVAQAFFTARARLRTRYSRSRATALALPSRAAHYSLFRQIFQLRRTSASSSPALMCRLTQRIGCLVVISISEIIRPTTLAADSIPCNAALISKTQRIPSP